MCDTSAPHWQLRVCLALPPLPAVVLSSQSADFEVAAAAHGAESKMLSRWLPKLVMI